VSERGGAPPLRGPRGGGGPPGAPAPTQNLAITLEAAGGKIIPLRMRTADGWRPVSGVQPAEKGRPHEYLWRVSEYAGRHLRIVLTDADNRPSCYLVCSGFHLLSAEDFDVREFLAHMRRLEREHGLAPMTRHDSKHFLAIGNAADEYVRERLTDCETIYALFFEHFRRKGFPVREPGVPLMVAVFDTQAGLEAYLGRRMLAAVTGVYHPESNRLIVYDFASNRDFAQERKRGEEKIRQSSSNLDRQRLSGSFSRLAQLHRAGMNTSTVMHEVAHQLSFNSGLLERDSDVPLWLAEGLACYCEATTNGAWQGIGEANPQRAARLARSVGDAGFVPLRRLVASDDWLRKAASTDEALLGYSQSWALFRMLMEQRPRALRTYLALLSSRRTPEHRLDDFLQAFGSDFAGLERDHHAYLLDVGRREARPR
jgi:hypothetical protein